MAWVKREYSKGAIDRAGSLLVPWWVGPYAPLDAATPYGLEIGDAYGITENWRTSHAFPLNTFQIVLRGRARRIDRNAIVAQRLKRFSSIMNKLAREENMKLSQMQDLGGCRAILRDVAAVRELMALYRDERTLFDSASSLKRYDYITHPKNDGYRGVHIVGRYHARAVEHTDWDGHRIEVQLRSRLQHAFATAVETVTTFTSHPLKFGAGPAEWRRFFSLMGSALALREGTSFVPHTALIEADLIAELRDAERRLKVRQRLRGWSRALHTLPRRKMKGFKWLLLVLNTTANTIKVTGFADRQKASTVVAELEQQKRDDIDAVLVWVRRARDLRAAYPNYYADTREFINALNTALQGGAQIGCASSGRF